jgi:DNA (cytosine-5)-methyltransferase 1
MDQKPTLVDLFCGCGGFGLGAELAGFRTIAAVDVDSTLQSAYKNNFPNTAVVNGDLSKMNEHDWEAVLNGQQVDGVIGGPPCQGYSRMGVCDINDPRRKLLEDFFRHVNMLNPKFFVMENVEGLVDKKNRPQLDKAISIVDKKYTILGPMVIDASDCGVPTKRKRVIVIGFDESRMNAVRLEQLMFNRGKTTVSDAIRDLPSPMRQSKQENNYGYSEYPLVNNISEYAKLMRSAPPEGLGSIEACNEQKLGRVSGLFTTFHSPNVKLRYESTPQGKTESISRSKKLAWDGLCPTLRAGTGVDKGSHQAVRPLHPEHGRVITVREAARLQGFPDWFTFHPAKWHSFRMIGNSVSPIVSKEILSVMYQAVGHIQEETKKVA